MFKILWKRGEIAPKEQFLLLFTIFSYLTLGFYVKTRVGFSLRDRQLFEITEVEITRVDCSLLIVMRNISNFITSLSPSYFIGTLMYYLNHSQELVGQRVVVTTWTVDWQDSDVFVH